MISIISDNTKTKLITKKSTLGGAKLSEHWRGERGLTTKEMIKSGKYDIVVLQDYSLGPVEVPDSVKKYMGLFCKLIRQTGAKPYLYLTWAREKSPQTIIMKNVIPVILLAFLISSGSSVFAQVKADTLKVLFVGNSYTYYGNLAQVS